MRDSADRADLGFLVALEGEIEARKQSTSEKSYTKHLLDGGAGRIGAKICEEAAELAEALVRETDDRVANEAADVIYHVLVGLSARGIRLRDAVRVLESRAGTSGHVEKASRGE